MPDPIYTADTVLLTQILNRLDIISATILLIIAGIFFYKIYQFLYKLIG